MDSFSCSIYLRRFHGGLRDGNQVLPYLSREDPTNVLCIILMCGRYRVFSPFTHTLCWKVLLLSMSIPPMMLLPQPIPDHNPTAESSSRLLPHRLEDPAAITFLIFPHLQAIHGRTPSVNPGEGSTSLFWPWVLRFQPHSDLLTHDLNTPLKRQSSPAESFSARPKWECASKFVFLLKYLNGEGTSGRCISLTAALLCWCPSSHSYHKHPPRVMP